ncbi:hypothetical protein QJS10_CPB17g01896 [Acorus calamus]|uniref:Gnk2-homologous domain-containing protein n=1 Tax=Acorus calamus TaxID=4465 RepID=A0AAV9CUZ2_ACOCL|nr:hypothetical protein QJS10_CPB17g01896 [Acorus calamus]
MMAIYLAKAITLAMLALQMVSCTPNTNVTSVLCNSGVYTSGDPFGASLSYILSDLEAVTPTKKDRDYRNISPYPNAFAYGHAACNAILSESDCAACLTSANASMFASCDMRIGARCVLYDCNVRYEQYPFND